MLSTKKIGRISFNTAFLNSDQNILVFKLREIDPDNLVRNKNIAKDFEIHLKFNKLCECQNKELPIKLCNTCTNLLNVELTDWKEINEILNVIIYLNSFIITLINQMLKYFYSVTLKMMI